MSVKNTRINKIEMQRVTERMSHMRVEGPKDLSLNDVEAKMHITSPNSSSNKVAQPTLQVKKNRRRRGKGANKTVNKKEPKKIRRLRGRGGVRKVDSKKREDK